MFYNLSTSELGNIDKQIERLYKCQLLTEQEIKVLCEKVTLTHRLSYAT